MKINPYLQNIAKISGDHTPIKNEKTISAQSAGLESPLKEMGVSSSAEMQAAYKIYKNANQEPTKTIMSETQKFFEKIPGSSESKLTTIQAASAKGVEITEKNLTAIHSALNDQSNEAMATEALFQEEFSAAEGQPLSDKDVAKAVGKLPERLKNQVYSALKEMGYTEAEAVEMGDRLMAGESVGSILADQHRKMVQSLTGEALKKIQDLAVKGPKNLIEALAALENRIKITVFKIKITTETTTVEGGVGQLVNEDALSKELGNFLDAVGGLKWDEGQQPAKKAATTAVNSTGTQAAGLLKTETDDLSTETEGLSAETEDAASDFLGQLESLVDNTLGNLISAYGQADLQTMFESRTTKTVLITEVTIRMVSVKKDFDLFKKDVLAAVDKALEKPDKQALAEVAVKVADKLDRLIMQSDLTLYTDMKTERKLVGISSDLQKVAMLAKTSPEEAVLWLKETKKKLDKLLFEPSKEKVQIMLKDEAQKSAGVSTQSVLQHAGKMGNGAKSVLDLMRTMGLNHEVELMDAVFSSESTLKNDETKDNLKQILLKLSASDQEDQRHLVKSIEKGLGQLTGQQLLNKPELQSDSQSMFFNLPIKFGEDTSQMKLYVKARKSVEKMDWENCSMYFLVDLKQYGETGVRIQSNQRQLSISISNKSEDIMAVIEPFAKDILNELKEIGYNPGEIRYVPSGNEPAVPAELPRVQPRDNFESDAGNPSEVGRKGFEIKI